MWCDGVCSSSFHGIGMGATFHSQHYLLSLGITPDAGIIRNSITQAPLTHSLTHSSTALNWIYIGIADSMYAAWLSFCHDRP